MHLKIKALEILKANEGKNIYIMQIITKRKLVWLYYCINVDFKTKNLCHPFCHNQSIIKSFKFCYQSFSHLTTSCTFTFTPLPLSKLSSLLLWETTSLFGLSPFTLVSLNPSPHVSQITWLLSQKGFPITVILTWELLFGHLIPLISFSVLPPCSACSWHMLVIFLLLGHSRCVFP